MKTLIKRLPLFAFVLAAFAAFAFTSPESETLQYGTPDGGETWVQVNVPNSPNYRCNVGSEACTYEDESMANPIGTSNKQFELIP